MLRHSRAFSAARGAVKAPSCIIVPFSPVRAAPLASAGTSLGVVQQQQHASSSLTQQQRRAATVAHAKKKEAQAPSSSAGSSSSGDADLDMVALEVETDTEERMQKCVNVVVENFNTMRTGRANPAILDKILVDYYGTPTPIKTLASVAVPDASTLLISPFDRSGLRDIEKAILESDIGINPSNDGEKIRLNIPPMTQDRRKELVKKVSKMGEDGKVAVRNVRKDSMKRLDKHDFPKDARKSLEDSIQKITDKFVKSVDDLVKSKSDELMKV